MEVLKDWCLQDVFFVLVWERSFPARDPFSRLWNAMPSSSCGQLLLAENELNVYRASRVGGSGTCLGSQPRNL